MSSKPRKQNQYQQTKRPISEAAKQKQKKRKSGQQYANCLYQKAITSEINGESDSKVVKSKQKKKPPMINESLVSEDEVKRKANIFENELHNIIFWKKINLLKVCITAFFSP